MCVNKEAKERQNNNKDCFLSEFYRSNLLRQKRNGLEIARITTQTIARQRWGTKTNKPRLLNILNFVRKDARYITVVLATISDKSLGYFVLLTFSSIFYSLHFLAKLKLHERKGKPKGREGPRTKACHQSSVPRTVVTDRVS